MEAMRGRSPKLPGATPTAYPDMPSVRNRHPFILPPCKASARAVRAARAAGRITLERPETLQQPEPRAYVRCEQQGPLPSADTPTHA